MDEEGLDMKKSINRKSQKEITIRQSIRNNLFAFRLAWSLSRSRVLHTVFSTAIGYAIWIFYSAYYVRYVINAIQSHTPYGEILRSILIIGGSAMVLIIYQIYVENVVFPITDITIYDKLYRKLYHKSENVELACFEDSSFYNKYTMALDDACTKITSVTNQLSNIILGSLTGIASFIIMYQIDKGSVLFIISPLLGTFLFGSVTNRLTFQRYQASVPYKRKTDYVNRVMYLSDYSKEMRLSNIYRLLKAEYMQAVEGLSSMGRKFCGKILPFGFGQFYLSFAVIFEGVLLYGAYKTIVVGNIVLADFAVLASIMTTASWAWIYVMQSLVESNKNGMFIHNLRHFLDYKETIPEDYDGDLPANIIESIEFRNVSFSYKEGEPIIRNMSFKIQGNSSVALVGHNGAGKTTIIKLLFRLYDPTEGQILVNGKDIRSYNLRAYRNLFAAAFQDYKVFADTVKYNILMGRTVENPEEEVTTALKRVGLYDKIMSLPKGIDTELTKEFDEDGAVLSGGEYQKLVVARAFANHAPIKVFDEPSSALDPIAEYELFESILEESKDNTMIFISHRLSSVKNTDMVFMLEQGELIEQGTHRELMERNGKYASMYRMQAKNYFAMEEQEAEAVMI